MKLQIVSMLLATAMLMQDVRLAEVEGSVLDMEGKPVAQAAVVLKNLNTGLTYKLMTDDNGRFRGIGIKLGQYQIEITAANGRHIYSGQRWLYAGNLQKLNVIQIDLSSIPSKASLVPFKGPKISANAANPKNSSGKLTAEQLAEIRADNAKIVQFNRLLPDIQQAISEQKWSRAEELLQQLAAIAPYQWEIHQNLAMVQSHLEKQEEAAKSFEKAIQLVLDPATGPPANRAKPEAAQMMMAQGDAYASLNRMDAAAASYRKATETDPRLALAWLHLCTVEYNNGNIEESVAACNRAIAIQPLPEFYQTLAAIYNNLGRYQDSIKTYEKGIEAAQSGITITNAGVKTNPQARFIVPRIGQMLLAEGNVYFQLRDYKHAATLFQHAALMHSYPSLAYFNLCATLYDMDDWQGALDACNTAIALDPKMADPYFAKASALVGHSAKRGARHKVPESAVESLQKYLELAPEGIHASDARAMLSELSRAN